MLGISTNGHSEDTTYDGGKTKYKGDSSGNNPKHVSRLGWAISMKNSPQPITFRNPPFVAEPSEAKQNSNVTS